MSYLSAYRRNLGGVLDTAKDAFSAAGNIVLDPALPEITSIVLRLNALEKKRAPGTPDAKGIGLRYAVPPLKGFLYYRQHPWLVPAGVLAILGLAFYGGSRYGKRAK